MAGAQSRLLWDDSSMGRFGCRHYLLEELDVKLGSSIVDTGPFSCYSSVSCQK